MPGDAPNAVARGIAAAEHHTAAGDAPRARELLESLAASVPAGPERAEVLDRLADAVGDDLSRSIALCEQALEEAGDAPALVASIHVALSIFTWLAGDLRASLDHTRAAAAAAERARDDRALAIALGEIAHAEAVLGVGDPRRTIAPALELERQLGEFPANARPSFQLGIICLYTDALAEARPLLERPSFGARALPVTRPPSSGPGSGLPISSCAPATGRPRATTPASPRSSPGRRPPSRSTRSHSRRERSSTGCSAGSRPLSPRGCRRSS